LFGSNCRLRHDEPPLLQHTANAVNPKTNLADRIGFYHAAMGSPALSTLCDAIDSGFLVTFPGELTSAQVRRHPPTLVAMIKGHLDQQRANLRSTKPKFGSTSPPNVTDTETVVDKTTEDAQVKEDMRPTPTEPPALKSHHIFAKCESVTGQVYMDQTGRFLVKSSSGYSDMLVLYDYDSNFIHVEPMKSKSGAEILAVYKHAPQRCRKRDSDLEESLHRHTLQHRPRVSFAPLGQASTTSTAES
jgi:hypothetical protein